MAGGQFYQLLVDWVEKGIAPDRIEIKSRVLSVVMNGARQKRSVTSADTLIGAYPI